MQRNPFEVLGLNQNCTQAELHDAYIRLKGKYLKDRFKEGAEGAEAAKQLEIIETAYSDALEQLSNNYTINEGKTAYSQIEDTIKANEIDKAQEMLDSIVERGAEWHYYQSVIFYKKNWMMESRKQLQLAISLDPGNEKYIGTLNRLEEHMRSKNPFSNFKENTTFNGDTSRSYTDPNTQRVRGDRDACCSACETLVCADCCCECMGGDLISCC